MTKAAPREKTAYHILRAPGRPPAGGAPMFELVAADVSANSADAAIRNYAENVRTASDHPQTYVAVPSRSWQARTVREVHTRTLKLDEAAIAPPRPARGSVVEAVSS